MSSFGSADTQPTFFVPSPPFDEFPERRSSRCSDGAVGNSSFDSNSIGVKTTKDMFGWETTEARVCDFQAIRAWGCHDGYGSCDGDDEEDEDDEDDEEDEDDEDEPDVSIRAPSINQSQGPCHGSSQGGTTTPSTMAHVQTIGKGARAMEMLHRLHADGRANASTRGTLEYYKTSGDFLPWREQLGVTDSRGMLAFYDAHPTTTATIDMPNQEAAHPRSDVDVDIAHV
jgi:hypothetical protein